MKGSIVAVVTPMLENTDIDFTAFRRLVRWHVESGTEGIVVCGTTGEAATLTEDEQMNLLRCAVEECKGAIPVIMGTGTFDTATSVRRTQKAKELGASACLVIIPYYSRPTFRGCFAHFLAIAGLGLEVIVYHHPGRTGTRLSPSQLRDLCAIDGVVALKDASADVEACMEFMRLSSKALLSGDDLLTLPLIAAGAQGSISVVANVFPREWAEFNRACLEGRYALARAQIKELSPVIKSLFLTSNPECVKHAMHYRHLCGSALRLPLLAPGDDIKKLLESSLNEYSRCRENGKISAI